MENWLHGQSLYAIMAIIEQKSVVKVQVPWRFRYECSHWKTWKNNIMYTGMNWAQKSQNTGSVCDHCESRRIQSVHTPEAIDRVREVTIQYLFTLPDVGVVAGKLLGTCLHCIVHDDLVFVHTSKDFPGGILQAVHGYLRCMALFFWSWFCALMLHSSLVCDSKQNC
jgi:hypothetical protein